MYVEDIWLDRKEIFERENIENIRTIFVWSLSWFNSDSLGKII